MPFSPSSSYSTSVALMYASPPRGLLRSSRQRNIDCILLGPGMNNRRRRLERDEKTTRLPA